MVWTHHPTQPVSHAPVFGPWLGRILTRMRAILAPAPDRTSSWPAALIAAAETPIPQGAIPGPVAGGIGVTRVGRSTLQRPTITPTAALAGAMAAPISAVMEPARFHSLDEDTVSIVYFLSHRSGPGLACLDWLTDHGLPFRRIGALHPTAPVWSAPQGALLLVDLDTLGGLSEMAEPLMRLRLNRPDLSVVLLTEEVETHDFGTEQLVLADITLRLPCAFASFEFALAEAPINNAAWQERLLGDQG